MEERLRQGHAPWTISQRKTCDDGRMAGHQRHETHGGAAPDDGRGWYGGVVRAGLGPGAGARGSAMCTGPQMMFSKHTKRA
jgi:hypothetical protein